MLDSAFCLHDSCDTIICCLSLTVCECLNMLLADLEEQKKGKYVLIRDDAEDSELGQFYKPLPCFGFGIGWFS